MTAILKITIYSHKPRIVAVLLPAPQADTSPMKFPPRVSFPALVLGAALVAMSVSIIGAPVSLAITPVMHVIENRANPLVIPTVTVISALTVSMVLLGLRLASSMFARNALLFAAARVAAIVYLADLVIGLVQAEIQKFLYVTVSNATQLDFRSLAGRLFMTIVLPLIGVALVVAVAPRLLHARSQ